MKIQTFINEFKLTFVYDLLRQTLTDEQLLEHSVENGQVIWFKEQMRQMWLMWEKAQAVPEGFILVPKEPTDKTIARMINTPIEVNLLCDHADIFLSEGEAYIAYQAMIEAQEPAND